jgi:hypothetical protein
MREYIKETPVNRYYYQMDLVVAFRDFLIWASSLEIRILKTRNRGTLHLMEKNASSWLDSIYQVTNHG